MTTKERYPFWLKASMILIGLCLLIAVMIYGKFILLPLAFAGLFSLLLNPLVRIFEKWKLGRSLSIIVTLFLVLIFLGGILTLFITQFVQFSDRVPEVVERLKSVADSSTLFLEESIGISEAEQSEYFRNSIERLFDRSGAVLGSLASATTGILTIFSLLPIFTFFMLYYKEMYRTFFRKVFEHSSSRAVDDVIFRIQEVTQNYMVGLITVMGLLAILNTVGLLIIGLEYAIFFGIFAAFMAVIPYIGIIIGALPPLLFALLLGESLITPVLVIAVFATVQFLEGNFITPKIVGSKVAINPFVAIIALLIGGEIWGVAGMILFVPMIGILKVVFSQIEELKPYSYLLGNQIEYKT